MSELSPRARQVLRSSVTPPTLADRERIRTALQARLGATMPMAKGGALPAAGSRWSLVSSAIIGLGLIGGVLFLLTRHEPEALRLAGAPAPSAIAMSAVSPITDSVPPVESATFAALPAPSAPDATAPRSLPASDRLAQEVALMERATTALHAGHAAAALKVLDESQRRFPTGSLTLERRAARAQALCTLGRGSEAQLELAALPARSPGVARAKQVCDAASKPEH
jgi:hypothetical protein